MYCPECYVPLTATPSIPPLPFKVSVVTHVAEGLSKATGVQLKVLCPDQVDLHIIEQEPQGGFDPARSLVLFPSDEAIEPQDIEPGSIDRVFVIDSKW
jgi:hypothetical protein